MSFNIYMEIETHRAVSCCFTTHCIVYRGKSLVTAVSHFKNFPCLLRDNESKNYICVQSAALSVLIVSKKGLPKSQFFNPRCQ
jgi:hypothetical protein